MTDRDDYVQDPETDSKPGMSGCAKAGIGCAVVLGICAIAAVIGGIWVSRNFRELGTDFAISMTTNVVKEGQLPEEQEKRIIARLNDVGAKFKRGDITGKQVEKLLKAFMEGPLMPASSAIVVKRAYIDKSGFDEAEAAAANIAVQRFVRGVVDETIPEPRREGVLDRISVRKGQNNREFKQKLTDNELRLFIEDAAAAADEAGVAEEVPEINFADEFDKVVDEAIGVASGQSPSEEPAE